MDYFGLFWNSIQPFNCLLPYPTHEKKKFLQNLFTIMMLKKWRILSGNSSKNRFWVLEKNHWLDISPVLETYQSPPPPTPIGFRLNRVKLAYFTYSNYLNEV